MTAISGLHFSKGWHCPGAPQPQHRGGRGGHPPAAKVFVLVASDTCWAAMTLDSLADLRACPPHNEPLHVTYAVEGTP